LVETLGMAWSKVWQVEFSFFGKFLDLQGFSGSHSGKISENQPRGPKNWSSFRTISPISPGPVKVYFPLICDVLTFPFWDTVWNLLFPIISRLVLEETGSFGGIYSGARV